MKHHGAFYLRDHHFLDSGKMLVAQGFTRLFAVPRSIIIQELRSLKGNANVLTTENSLKYKKNLIMGAS